MTVTNKQIPVGPVSPFKKLFSVKKNTSSFCKKNSLALTSARAGIALALQQLEITAGDKVLIPAFHCIAMVEPVEWLGITPVFYKIKKNCHIDFEDLRLKIDPKVKAIIIVHYFGFPQDVQKVRKFCDQNKIYLIEDCAHSFWGESSGIGLGESGDWAVTSAMKFFPVLDGGFLYSSKHLFAGQKVSASPVLTNLKTFFNTFEKAFKFGRMKFLSKLFKVFLSLKDIIWTSIKKQSKETNQFYYLSSASHGGYSFEPFWMDKKMSWMSQWVIRLSCQKDIIKTRRTNYIKLLAQIKALPGVLPVFPDLPDHVVPHVFPIIVNDPEKVFNEFKKNDVPFLRFGETLWQGVDKSLCQISSDYSKKGFQLPCHQDLTREELSLLITKLTDIFLNIVKD